MNTAPGTDEPTANGLAPVSGQLCTESPLWAVFFQNRRLPQCPMSTEHVQVTATHRVSDSRTEAGDEITTRDGDAYLMEKSV